MARQALEHLGILVYGVRGIAVCAIILLFLVSFIYGIPVFVAAMAIFMGLLLLPARVYVWVASLVSMGILLWNYASFDYVTVLSLPTQFTHLVHGIGVLKAFAKVTDVQEVQDITTKRVRDLVI